MASKDFQVSTHLSEIHADLCPVFAAMLPNSSRMQPKRANCILGGIDRFGLRQLSGAETGYSSQRRIVHRKMPINWLLTSAHLQRWRQSDKAQNRQKTAQLIGQKRAKQPLVIAKRKDQSGHSPRHCRYHHSRQHKRLLSLISLIFARFGNNASEKSEQLKENRILPWRGMQKAPPAAKICGAAGRPDQTKGLITGRSSTTDAAARPKQLGLAALARQRW